MRVLVWIVEKAKAVILYCCRSMTSAFQARNADKSEENALVRTKVLLSLNHFYRVRNACDWKAKTSNHIGTKDAWNSILSVQGQ